MVKRQPVEVAWVRSLATWPWPVVLITAAGLAVVLWVVVPWLASGSGGAPGGGAGGGDGAGLGDLVGIVSRLLGFVLVLGLLLGWLVARLQRLRASALLEGQAKHDSLEALTWQDFEELLGEVFRRKGYRVEPTVGGADGGVDLILHGPEGCVLVQAKHWQRSQVGVKVVRELYGVQQSEGAAGSILVTSGSVTEEARRFAERAGVRLIEGGELRGLIGSVQSGGRGGGSSAGRVDAGSIRAGGPPPLPGGERLGVGRAGQVGQGDGAMGRIEGTETQAGEMPECPVCGSAMVQRVARRGANAGEAFWGCSRFPNCRGTRRGQRPREQ